jgi:hypothetical protein
MGITYRRVNSLPELGTRLIKIQEKDLAKCVEYFKLFKIEQGVFPSNKSLIKLAHGVAFSMNMFTAKLTDIPKWVVPYLAQLTSDSIQILPSIILNQKRTLHLYERAGIEDFLRYTYYLDHKIEHALLQIYPKKFQSIDSMIDWLEEYPDLTTYKELVSEECGKLSSRHAELSRAVHGTTLADQQIVKNIRDLNAQKIDAEKEERILKSIFQSIFFLLSAFHIDHYRRLQLDERALIGQYLDGNQIEALSGLKQ